MLRLRSNKRRSHHFPPSLQSKRWLLTAPKKRLSSPEKSFCKMPLWTSLCQFLGQSQSTGCLGLRLRRMRQNVHPASSTKGRFSIGYGIWKRLWMRRRHSMATRLGEGVSAEWLGWWRRGVARTLSRRRIAAANFSRTIFLSPSSG